MFEAISLLSKEFPNNAPEGPHATNSSISNQWKSGLVRAAAHLLQKPYTARDASPNTANCAANAEKSRGGAGVTGVYQDNPVFPI
jgi:hypothetical protein